MTARTTQEQWAHEECDESPVLWECRECGEIVNYEVDGEECPYCKPEPSREREEGEICEVCGRRSNLAWHTPDDLWLEIVGHKEGHWCAECFTAAVHKTGMRLYWEAGLNPASRERRALTLEEIEDLYDHAHNLETMAGRTANAGHLAGLRAILAAQEGDDAKDQD